MKKKVALVLTLATLLTSGSAFALELENVESTAEATVTAPVEAETTAEAELQALTITPGKNLFTGTASLVTFDNESDLDIYSDHHNFNTMTIVENPQAYTGASIDADGSKGKMVEFHRNANPSGHWAGYAYKDVKFDGDRKYWFTWDEYWDMEGVSTLWAVFTDFYAKGHWDLGLNPNNHGNHWRRYDYVNTPGAGRTLYMQSKSSNVKIENDQSQPTVPTNLYIDNVGVYPYYKVTYVLDDAPVRSEQFLFKPGTTKNAVEAIATEFTPDKSVLPEAFSKNGYVYKPLGWATTPNATEPEETITLNGEDIVLFPVYEAEQRLTISAQVASATADTHVTVRAIETTASGATFKQFLGWDFGFSGARSDWEVGDTEFDIISSGRNGSVTIKAQYSDNVDCYISVQFVGAKIWKPGLNIFTGTKEDFDFEGISSEQLATLFEGKPTNILVDNTNKSGSNYSNKAMIMNGGSYPNRFLNYFDAAIANDRPLYISYDYYGSFNEHWLMKNSSSSTDYCMVKLHELGYRSSDTWKSLTVDKLVSTAKNTADVQRIGFEIGKGSTEGTIYYDNINITPYYRIDYYSADGKTCLYTDYALIDEKGEFLKEYTPNLTYAQAAAVSTSVNGDRALTVPLQQDDVTLYALPEAPVTFIVQGYYVKQQKDVVLSDVGGSYTVLTPDQMGFGDTTTVQKFVAWADQDGELIFPGDVIPASKFDSYKGKIYEPYCFDRTMPATGFSYEGAGVKTGEKIVYTEDIEDEGRSVFHMHQYGSTFNTNESKWMNDARAHFRWDSGAGVDIFKASEYNIVQYAYKVNNAKNVKDLSIKPEELKPEDLVDATTAQMNLYYYTEMSADGFYNKGEHRVSGYPIQIQCDNKYHIYECDMSIPSNGNGVAWTDGTGGYIWGFAVDPAKVSYAADVYIDYIRVYRDGLLTVTYDTNSPTGLDEDVEYNVPADTGRGGGVKYYLKGDRPVLKAEAAKEWVFLGWSLSREDADKGIVTDYIPLLERHATVYASWGYNDGVPDVSDTISMRSDYAKGVRFSSTISADSRDLASEYGYLIAREDVLNEKGEELTFHFNSDTETVTTTAGNKAPKPLYAKGVAYSKDTGVDYQYAQDDSGNVTFTAVCINVPEEHYATRLVARSYMKYDVNGKAVTMYGTTKTTSLKEAAQTIKDAGGQDYEENRAYVDEILSK